jgi:hypothetical protein
VLFEPIPGWMVEKTPAPTSEELAGAAAFFEQVDPRRYPRSGELSRDCTVVRFPSLDTNLLWPFAATNPYDAPRFHDPEGRCAFGDRVLLRCIDRGWHEDRIVDHYLNDYDAFRIDLRRFAAIERARLRARDAEADVKGADIVADIVSEELFWANNHPRARVLGVLAERLAAAAVGAIPELAGFSPSADWFAESDAIWAPTAVPIHPGVAAELGLSWYDPDATYPQRDGSVLTFAGYVRAYVRWSIEHRALQLARSTAPAGDPVLWHPPTEGPVRIVGPAPGIYADGFAAPQAAFELEAIEPIETLSLRIYFPPQHRRAGTVVCAFGTSKAQAVMEPGTPSTLTLELPLEAGARARFSMTCTETLNMFERGESTDYRDLGVLILGVRAA